MSLETRPKTFTISFGEGGEFLLTPKEIVDVGLARDLFFSAIGLLPETNDLPMPCFDLEQLRRKNALAGAARADKERKLCN